MRIVSKAELVKMPKGTLFADFREDADRMWTKGPEFILHSPVFLRDDEEPNDFFYASIDTPDHDDLWELVGNCDDMVRTGKSYPVDLVVAREGLYDSTSRYIVWEPDDVARIINLLQGGDEDD
jgi:hypothetical protein